MSKKNSSFGFHDYAKNFSYNAAGAVTSLQLGNGRWESTTFNSRLQPTQIALGTVQNGYDKLKLNYSYGDWVSGSIDATKNNGNIVQQIITTPNSPGNSDEFAAIQKYYYDSLNRIDDATEDISGQTWRQDFSYDRYGNRTFVEANTTTLPKECNGNTEVCEAIRPIVNPSATSTTNKLIGYAYDASGNTTEDAREWTFIYDAENKQVEVKDDQDVTLGQYWYDGDGKRVKKYVPSTGEVTIFVYDVAGKLIQEHSTIVESVNDAKVAYLTNDHLGSPRINTDANGAVTARHDYHPFGEEISTTQRTGHSEYGDDTVRKQFTGYQKDEETGLDFAEARMYENRHGRFTAVDPLLASGQSSDPQSFNRYSYTMNNPVNLVDPSGMLSSSTGACGQWCPGTGEQVDGSVFHGEDASFSWIPELVRGLTARSEGADGKPVALSSDDQRSLRRSLQPLAFGTIVTKQGLIYAPRGRTIGRKLLTGISRSGFNVTIIVNHRGVFSTGPVKSDLTVNLNGYITNATSDTSVLWDPKAGVELEERRGKGRNGRIVSALASSTVVLAHELIHAYNWTRPGRVSPLEMGPHIFQEGSIRYMEDWYTNEFRAVGLGYNRLGDITENEIRAQLGLPRRAAYTSRENWFVCGGSSKLC